MKSQAARPLKFYLVVDHVALMFLTVRGRKASVASIYVAERRMAHSVAIVGANMKLPIIIIHQHIQVFVLI